jgi:hypothetical protein
MEGEPRIAVGDTQAESGLLIVDPRGIDDDEVEIVGERLREALIGVT